MQRIRLTVANAGSGLRESTFRAVWVSLLALLFSSAFASADDCKGWGTAGYFSEASLSAVSACLKAGADPNFRDESGLTALHASLRYSLDPAVARVLLENGADLAPVTDSGWGPLHVAARYAFNSNVISVLRDAGADPNLRAHDGSTPLHVAAQHGGRPWAIVELQFAGADLNARDEKGDTPLHVAAFHAEDPHFVKVLLEASADPFLYSDGWSPLALAASHNPDHRVAGHLLESHLVEGAVGPVSPGLLHQQSGLKPARCWFDAEAFWPRKECFFMVVEEDLDDPLSSFIAFPVVRFSAREGGSSGNPILHLGGGGPGGPVGLETDPSHLWSTYKRMVLTSGRDFYVMDPRGVGMSYPRLHCLEAYESALEALGRNVSIREENDIWNASYQTCKQRLDEDGRELSNYNSRTVARDAELLRRTLGVDKWVLYGFSYGARYALTIARDFPDSVESMVLSSAALPGVPTLSLAMESETDVFERAFLWCEDAGTCEANSLRERFWTLIHNLNQAPLVLEDLPSSFLDDHSLHRFVLTGDRLVSIVSSALYDPETYGDFADLVEELELAKTRVLESALDAWLSDYLDVLWSDPVYLSHYCREEHPFVDYERAVHDAKHSDNQVLASIVIEELRSSRSGCESWNLAPAEPIEAEPVKSSLPVLFLQGALDPATPVDRLKHQLPNFSNHALLVFDDSSHWGEVEGSCAMGAAGHFIVHKGLDEEHHRCGMERAGTVSETP